MPAHYTTNEKGTRLVTGEEFYWECLVCHQTVWDSVLKTSARDYTGNVSVLTVI